MSFQTSTSSMPPFNMPMFFPQSNTIQNQYQPTFTQPQAPQERKARLNWQKLNSIDLERLHEPSNIHLLEACLGNITYASLDQQDCEKFADPTLLKMFRLSQYSLEYLMNYQNYLYNQSQNLDMAYRQAEESLHPLEQKARENQAEIQRLREDLKKKKKNINAYQHTLSTPLFKCTTCKKYFKSQDYLDEHTLRRHSTVQNGSRDKRANNPTRIVLKDSSTSPLNPHKGILTTEYIFNHLGGTTRDPIYIYNQNEEEGSGQKQERGVLTEKSLYDENNSSVRLQETAALETMKGFIQKIRREDGEKISQLDEMLKGKFDEILKTNSEIGKRVQELEQKVEVKRSNKSRQSVSVYTEDEFFDHDKENQNQLSNPAEEHHETTKGWVEKEGDIRKSTEGKPKMAGWIPYREAREVKKQGVEGRKLLRLEDDLKITEINSDEAPNEAGHKEAQHGEPRREVPREDQNLDIRERDFRQKDADDTDNIQIEDLEEEEIEKEKKEHEAEKKHQNHDVYIPREHVQVQKEQQEKTQPQVQAQLQKKVESRRYQSQPFKSGDLEDDKVLKPSKDSISVYKAGKLEEDRNSDEEKHQSKRSQVIKLQKIQHAEDNRSHRRIEEVHEVHEGEPEFEDEDERERTIRIIESSIGIRGDEDKLLEKDRKAFMKAREAMNRKYLADHVETEEIEQAKNQVDADINNRFNQLFGDNYDALAGAEVINLEAILANLRNLNEKQKDRFTRMKTDYSKIQRKDVLMFDEKRPVKESEGDDGLLPERSHIEEDLALQAKNRDIRRAKESLAELEQVIKESQESQETRKTPKSIDIY